MIKNFYFQNLFFFLTLWVIIYNKLEAKFYENKIFHYIQINMNIEERWILISKTKNSKLKKANNNYSLYCSKVLIEIYKKYV